MVMNYLLINMASLATIENGDYFYLPNPSHKAGTIIYYLYLCVWLIPLLHPQLQGANQMPALNFSSVIYTIQNTYSLAAIPIQNSILLYIE